MTAAIGERRAVTVPVLQVNLPSPLPAHTVTRDAGSTRKTEAVFLPKINLKQISRERHVPRSRAVSRAGKARWPLAKTVVMVGGQRHRIYEEEVLTVSTSRRARTKPPRLTTDAQSNKKPAGNHETDECGVVGGLQLPDIQQQQGCATSTTTDQVVIGQVEDETSNKEVNTGEAQKLESKEASSARM